MHSRSFGVAVLVVALLQVGRSFVAAQTDTPADETQRTEAARALFDEGIELADREQFDEAADRFRRAYALRASPSVAFNMAATLARAGHFAEALVWVDRVLDDPSARPRARTMATRLRAEVEPKVGRLTVTLDGDSEGVRVMLDGQPFDAEALGTAQPIDPGSHVVTAVRGPSMLARAQVDVAEGASVETTLHIPLPQPVAQAEDTEAPPSVSLLPAPEPERDSSEPITKKVWFWSAIGVVAAGAIVTITILAANGSEDPVEGNANPGVLVWK